ncbi:MAG: type II secretion system F family protein [Pseudolabrys sp.]
MQILAVFFLVSVAIGGVAYVFIYPVLSGERKAEQRIRNVASSDLTVRAARRPQKSRREDIETTLKDFEKRQKKSKNVPITVRIAHAGLSWSRRQFVIISASIGLGMFFAAFLSGTGLLPAAALGFAGAFGVPRWLLSFLKKRREARFLETLADAVDIIVRGVKAGLPLLDCMKMITMESPEPLKTEFRMILETQAIGVPLGEACAKLYERTPLPEANFFGIVVAIQQKAGGNLSEALGNLSKVLRDRKKMRAKIQAMSQEAKASAAIIGALPIAVMILVYITTPEYISLLFTHPTGHILLAGSAVWMTMGVLVMKKMINFDF